MRPLDLVHSDLDEMPVLSMGGYKNTATYLDDYSSFGVMFYLKKKSDEFTALKQYKAWAERQLGTTLKCRWFDQGGEFLSNEQKAYMIENRIETQMSMPDSVETEYCEMLFWVETERSDKELYWIIAQSRPVQMISY